MCNLASVVEYDLVCAVVESDHSKAAQEGVAENTPIINVRACIHHASHGVIAGIDGI